jgi:RHS repeat-associated protein
VWGPGGLFAQAARHSSYFRDEFPADNSSAAKWLSLTNFAVLQNGTNADIMTNATGNVFLPQTPESFAYDADGNLTQDGRWNYYWDGENRLISMAARTIVGPQISLRFDYDWKDRRIRKQVWGNTTWTGSATNDQRFAYDGWNLAGILTSSFTLQTSFTWGLDLSGTLQGAGGVGGLLFIGNWLSAIGYYAAAYDGNGNVAALVSAADGTASANYEYGLFGEVIRATGPMANANRFRFSTKYQDDEPDLLYYGYRYLNATTGRWVSRDPYGEVGGPDPGSHLPAEQSSAGSDRGSDYVFIRNQPLGRPDLLGLTLTFENESCHGCNAGIVSIFGSSLGYLETPAGTPCSWAAGGSGSFGHACANTPTSSGLCDTETHIKIRATNNARCCKRYLITCSWDYSASLTGAASASMDVRLKFLGKEFYKLTDLKPGRGAPSSGPYVVRGTAGGTISGVAYIPPGGTIQVFAMPPLNVVHGRPDSIAEVGSVGCVGQCAEMLPFSF